ncbi:MAG: hypothetical protein J5600_01480, partial [Desulfovibrio sp.]|nr:hypothetical protein [Desulfovibrio sp.]
MPYVPHADKTENQRLQPAWTAQAAPSLAVVEGFLPSPSLRQCAGRVQGGLQALIHALSDIAGVVDQFYLRPVMTDQLPALLTDRVRHNDDRP